jgi:hypothetical protein
MNYKEIKQHNKKEQKLYRASWDYDACDWTYKKNTVCLYTFITEQAISDEGMTKQHKCIFHTINPNGLLAQMPSFDDFAYIDNPKTYHGAYLTYGKFDNYHAKQLMKFAIRNSGYTTWEVNYHMLQLKKELQQAKDLMVKKNLVGSLAA